MIKRYSDDEQTFSVERQYPAHWSRAYCSLALAWELLNGIDLRSVRADPRIKTGILRARRGARDAYKVLLDSDKP